MEFGVSCYILNGIHPLPISVKKFPKLARFLTDSDPSWQQMDLDKILGSRWILAADAAPPTSAARDRARRGHLALNGVLFGLLIVYDCACHGCAVSGRGRRQETLPSTARWLCFGACSTSHALMARFSSCP